MSQWKVRSYYWWLQLVTIAFMILDSYIQYIKILLFLDPIIYLFHKDASETYLSLKL